MNLGDSEVALAHIPRILAHPQVALRRFYRPMSTGFQPYSLFLLEDLTLTGHDESDDDPRGPQTTVPSTAPKLWIP